MGQAVLINQEDGSFSELFGNPMMLRLDGEAQAPLATLLAPATSDLERAQYGVYVATDFVPDEGYHVVGSASYAFPDHDNFPFYVQQTYSEEVNPPPTPTLEDRIVALEEWQTDMNASKTEWESDISALEAAMPTKATSAPPQVASSSVLGATDSQFALADHTHAINDTQQSQIVALQSNVGSLLSLTGGLNTPAPPNAIPPDIAGAGAAGVSTRYARQDHTHKGVQVSNATPIIAGAASAGTSADAARSDHVHPAQTVPSASNATPTALAVSGVSGSGTAFSRDDHVHPLPVVTPSTPTRSLNTNFTPSATKACWVSYTVTISCAMTISGGQTGTVELRSDTNATPTTARARAVNTNSGTLVVGVTITNAQTSQLVYLVPAGHNVRLVSSGTATITLETLQVETVIG